MIEAKYALDMNTKLECARIASGLACSIYAGNHSLDPKALADAIEVLTNKLYEIVN